MNDLHMSLRVDYAVDIFRNIDKAVAKDVIRTIESLGDTGQSKMRILMDQCKYEDLGKFISDEYNHYRANRGVS